MLQRHDVAGASPRLVVDALPAEFEIAVCKDARGLVADPATALQQLVLEIHCLADEEVALFRRATDLVDTARGRSRVQDSQFRERVPARCHDHPPEDTRPRGVDTLLKLQLAATADCRRARSRHHPRREGTG